MTNTFKYKRSTNTLDKLTSALDAESSKFGSEDKRFWRPEMDKAGTAYAVIRFLPAPPQDGESGLPWVKLFTHAFKGPSGSWYIENSRTTLGKSEKDPCGELNSSLWSQSEDPTSWQRKQASAQKRKLQYISNILVINDPKHPENNGKVFLYKYGKKIMEKIEGKMHPKIEGKKGVNPFDPFEGMNFELQVKTVFKFPNYDDASFESPSALVKTEKEFEEIWNQQYSLAEFVTPDKFKSYEELASNLKRVLGDGKAPVRRTVTDESHDEEDNAPSWEASAKVEDDDDAELAEFRKIANGLG